MIDHGDLLIRLHVAELDRRAVAAAQLGEVRRTLTAVRSAAVLSPTRSRAGHPPGVWCWLLDRVPARARRHAAA